MEDWPDRKKEFATAGEATGITVADEFFLKRGEIITNKDDKPSISDLLSTTIFWMGREPLQTHKEYTLKIGTEAVSCKVHSIDNVLDAQTLKAEKGKSALEKHDVGKVVLKTKRPVAYDPFTTAQVTGRFVIVDGYDVAGGGIIEEAPELLRARETVKARSMLISPKSGHIKRSARETRNGHKGAVVWVTGLPGSGKEEIAQALEERLFKKRINAYYLDSSNVRLSLSSDLSFSEKQRKEQTRRVAELANFLMDAGTVVVVSIVSPYKDDRDNARAIIGADRFIEVHIDCPLERCKERNPHGIYTAAEAGEITGVPGVDIAYEEDDWAERVPLEDLEDVQGRASELARLVERRVAR